MISKEQLDELFAVIKALGSSANDWELAATIIMWEAAKRGRVTFESVKRLVIEMTRKT